MKHLTHRGIFWSVSLGLILIFTSPVLADWNPGDPHKMHFPQLPDPQGWDVNMTFPKVLADDWRCSETGPVSDLHFWFSIERDSTQTLAALAAAGIVHARIHADIPATPTSFSRPGELLWERDFPVGPGSAFFRHYGTGNQGWYDPNPPPVVRRPDHINFFQMNIENILDPFVQQLGTIYWLDLSIKLPPSITDRVGWKTSLQHFNDDAVWGDFPTPIDWHELRDPITQQSLDLAFVITPEPGMIGLAAIGLLSLLRRR